MKPFKTENMDKIVLWNSVAKGRIRKVGLMDKEHYEKIKEFILSRFLEHNSVSLMAILDHPTALPAREFGTVDIMPLIILVKNDLEVRGVLKIVFNPDRSQTIALKKRRF